MTDTTIRTPPGNLGAPPLSMYFFSLNDPFRVRHMSLGAPHTHVSPSDTPSPPLSRRPPALEARPPRLATSPTREAFGLRAKSTANLSLGGGRGSSADRESRGGSTTGSLAGVDLESELEHVHTELRNFLQKKRARKAGAGGLPSAESGAGGGSGAYGVR